MKSFFPSLMVACAAICAAPAFAQTMPHDHMMPSGHMMKPEATDQTPAASATANAVTTPDAPSTLAYKEANARMHRAMDIAFSGNPSLDFLYGMIAHHRGAIDMARVVLKYGTDAQTRQLAQKIITAQEAEIAQMKAMALRLQK
jgi:uncharacterized protein (DUF305 family)